VLPYVLVLALWFCTNRVSDGDAVWSYNEVVAARAFVVCVALVLGLIGGACDNTSAPPNSNGLGNAGSGGVGDPFFDLQVRDSRCKNLGETLECGDDPRPECQTLLHCIDCCARPPCPESALPATCDAGESRLVWRQERRECAPEACPGSIDEARDQPCAPSGHVCPFPGGVSCHCWGYGYGASCSGPGPTWFCGDYRTAGCPEAGIPDVGTPCTDEGVECIGLHVGACDVEGEPARQCVEGSWLALEIPPPRGECI
jgi:hypothetical protein